MSNQVSDREYEAALSLSGDHRYSYFLKRVADLKEVWGLWDDGWSVARDDEGLLLPVWPAARYASDCTIAHWATNEPRRIDLAHLMEVMLAGLESDKTRVAVFPDPSGQGVVVDPSELRNDLARTIELFGE